MRRTMPEDRPAFGVYLRANRQRWHWWRSRGFFVRIAPHDTERELFWAELYPLTGLVPPGRHSPQGYVQYDSEAEAEETLESSPFLRLVPEPQGYELHLLDTAGNKVEE